MWIALMLYFVQVHYGYTSTSDISVLRIHFWSEVFPSYSQSCEGFCLLYKRLILYPAHLLDCAYFIHFMLHLHGRKLWILLEIILHKICFSASLHNAIPFQRIIFGKLISQLDWRNPSFYWVGISKHHDHNFYILAPKMLELFNSSNCEGKWTNIETC